MALSPEDQEWAVRHGVTPNPGESDEDFKRRLEGLVEHAALLYKARDLKATFQRNATIVDLRLAICKRYLEVLEEQGFVVGAAIRLGDRTVKIQRIELDRMGRKPKVTVHYWIVRPWEKNNDRGRANHKTAEEILEGGVLIK